MKSPLDHHELIRKSPLNILNHPCFPMKPPYLPAAAVTEPHLIRQDLALELHQDLVQQRSGQYQAGGPGVAVARARPGRRDDNNGRPRERWRKAWGSWKKPWIFMGKKRSWNSTWGLWWLFLWWLGGYGRYVGPANVPNWFINPIDYDKKYDKP